MAGLYACRKIRIAIMTFVVAITTLVKYRIKFHYRTDSIKWLADCQFTYNSMKVLVWGLEIVERLHSFIKQFGNIWHSWEENFIVLGAHQGRYLKDWWPRNELLASKFICSFGCTFQVESPSPRHDNGIWIMCETTCPNHSWRFQFPMELVVLQ